MTQNMSPEDRLQLMKFVCSFAWADLRIGQEERDFVHRMVRRLHLSPEEAQLVEGWLQHPPPPDEVDPMLVLAIMSVESSFNPKAQSHAGAQGLMQVLTRVHAEKFVPFGGIPAAFDPVANIRVGSAILKEYINREGSVEGALKSYVGAALAEPERTVV